MAAATRIAFRESIPTLAAPATHRSQIEERSADRKTRDTFREQIEKQIPGLLENYEAVKREYAPKTNLKTDNAIDQALSKFYAIFNKTFPKEVGRVEANHSLHFLNHLLSRSPYSNFHTITQENRGELLTDDQKQAWEGSVVRILLDEALLTPEDLRQANAALQQRATELEREKAALAEQVRALKAQLSAANHQ